MKYLFLVNIGPVQAFIASARRTRDLWFGSWLLSELAKAAAQEIANTNGLESLIFPAPSSEDMLQPSTSLNVANKIVALIDHSPQQLGSAVHLAIQKRLYTIRDEAFQGIGKFNQEAAYKQIDDLVEYFWVALPYEGNNYMGVRRNLEALMAARKNTRDFRKVTWGSGARKSSIDGQLESVIPNDLYPRSWEKPGTQERKAHGLYIAFHANVGEHLSGVDLLKRNGLLSTGDSFSSTSHFATIPFLQRLDTMKDKEQAKSAWDTYIQEIREVPARIERMPKNSPSHSIIGNCEGSMLLEERFSDLVDINDDMSIFKDAKKALQKFFQHVDDQFQDASPKVRPGTYYAILLADGDSMGKVIDHQAAAVDGEGQHRELSKVLANFSGKVRTIVEGDKDKKGHQGSLIYAGGDDVLAFLPLHTVIDCARKLSEAFYAALEDFKDKDNKSPTLSVGVAIIHHLQPLREALELARYAEKSAKHVDGKNALAITISKRSGGDFTVKGQWKSFVVHLNELIEFCRQESIPEGTAYELRDLSLKLAIQADDPESQLIRPELQKVMKTDAQRILGRKLTHHRRNKPNDENIMRHQRITALLEESEDIEHFANELIAAQFFADAMELAEPTKGTLQ